MKEDYKCEKCVWKTTASVRDYVCLFPACRAEIYPVKTREEYEREKKVRRRRGRFPSGKLLP